MDAPRGTLSSYLHLIVFDDPSPHAGGIQNMAYWIACTLAQKNRRVVVAGRADYLNDMRSIPGLEFFPIKRPFRTTHSTDLRLLVLLLRLRWRYGRYAIFYSMVINNLKVFRWIRSLLGWRAVSFLHGNETLRLVHHRPNTLRKNILACDAVFANSRYTRGIVERLQPFPNVVVVAPGIPFETFQHEPVDCRAARGWQGRKIVLMLSRLVRRKGHAMVIRAVAALKEKHPDILLVVAGKGGYRSTIEQMIDDAKIRTHAEMIGLVPEADKLALYRAATVFCMPSDETEESFETEGFGIAFIEAAAAKTLSIGSRTGGIPDAIEDGVSGFLVESGNVQQLTETLDRVLSGPGAFDELRAYAYKRAAMFDWSHQVDKLLDELNRRAPAIHTD